MSINYIKTSNEYYLSCNGKHKFKEDHFQKWEAKRVRVVVDRATAICLAYVSR